MMKQFVMDKEDIQELINQKKPNKNSLDAKFYYNFKNIDFSQVDLSVVPVERWYNCWFENINFRNSNIKFNLNWTKWLYGNGGYRFRSIENCDFSGLDLSHLTINDFDRVSIIGCDFSNTGLNVDFSKVNPSQHNAILNGRKQKFDITGVIFDKNYDNYPPEHWENLHFDIEALMLNPNIHISSTKLFHLIVATLPEFKTIIDLEEIEEIRNIIKKCEDYLIFDKDKDLIYLYQQIKEKANTYDLWRFWHRKLDRQKFSYVDLTSTPFRLLNSIYFENNYPKVYDSIPNNLPEINPNDWRAPKKSSGVIVRVNAYLELDRICNAKCKFCRNNSFDKCKYNLERLQESLLESYQYIDDLVIGGGEPKLRVNDLKKLKEYVLKHSKKTSYYEPAKKWNIFTNGSFNVDEIKEMLRDDYRFYISRHAVDDEENAKIFGISSLDILNTQKLSQIARYSDTALFATCFKGGLDTPNKIIQYLRYAQELGFGMTFISSLHKDDSFAISSCDNQLNINESVFEQVINHLLELGFERRRPIYSTGNYITTPFLLKKSNDIKFRVMVRNFITPEELLEAWPTATKRTLDLSFDPSGQLFENWHQTSEPVKKVK